MQRSTLFNGVLRYNPANPRYFTDESGKAVYLTGSHTWAVMQDLWVSTSPRRPMDYDGFLQLLHDNGHNFLRFWQWLTMRGAEQDGPGGRTVIDPMPYLRTGPGQAFDGGLKYDLDQWDEAYFARLTERIEKAGSLGIYVSVMMLDGWCIKWANDDQGDCWYAHPYFSGNNVNHISDSAASPNGKHWGLYSLSYPQLLDRQKSFIKKVVETVNGFDNVLFEVCNEMPDTPEALAWQEHLCQYIKNLESEMPKQHPVGITAEGGTQRNAELFATSADWISPGFGKYFEYRCSPPPADGTKVILSDTDHLWGYGADVPWIWKSFTRGMNVLFMDAWEPFPNLNGWMNTDEFIRNRRYYHAWDPIRRNLGYAGDFARGMDLNACVPRGDLCTSGYCLADEGKEYLCYLPTANQEGIDLCNASDARFELTYLDPDTGSSQCGVPVAGGGGSLLTSPFRGHAVAYLRKR